MSIQFLSRERLSGLQETSSSHIYDDIDNYDYDDDDNFDDVDEDSSLSQLPKRIRPVNDNLLARLLDTGELDPQNQEGWDL
jgi:hypothetical protein